MQRFRLTLIAIFVVILLPTVYLLVRSWDHLRTEATYAQKEHAYLILQMLNQRIYDDLAVEERRSYSEYRFIRAVQVIGGEEVTLSELAAYPVRSHYAGIIGHFQLEPDGSVRTPVLPDGLLEKIPVENRIEREALRQRIREVLESMDLRKGVSMRQVTAYPYVYKAPEDSVQTNEKSTVNLQTLFSKGRQFERRFETASQKEAIVFDVESEFVGGRDSHPKDSLDRGRARPESGVFDVEIEPFQATFNHQYLVFHRNVWRNEQRFLQGFVVHLEEYLGNLVYKEIRFSGNERNLRLTFGDGKTPMISLGAPGHGGKLLLATPLQYPLQEMEFAVTMASEGQPPGSSLVLLLGLTMIVVLAGGFYGVYKITASQMNISAKRQDFISAVSHELKTPLTAIRMYAEMLQNQWVVREEKRNHYYAMIASETERLTRLIQNVLNISNLEKHKWPVHLQLMNPARFLEEFIQKYGPTVEKAGFELESLIDPCDEELYLDRDACYQILMNLMDNALKFSRECEPKKIQIGLRSQPGDLCLFVRDFGPGISSGEQDRVFQDFYRVENEMTRKTSGAGIGLSLVKKFSTLLNIRVVLRNMHPGLQVELHLPGTDRFV